MDYLVVGFSLDRQKENKQKQTRMKEEEKGDDRSENIETARDSEKHSSSSSNDC